MHNYIVHSFLYFIYLLYLFHFFHCIIIIIIIVMYYPSLCSIILYSSYMNDLLYNILQVYTYNKTTEYFVTHEY